MNGVRRLLGAASGTATSSFEQQSPVYSQSTNPDWVPQLPPNADYSSSANPRLPTRTPSPPPFPKLANGSSPIRVPSRQNSSPISPDDTRAYNRRTNSVNSVHSRSSSAKSKQPPLPGHYKAASSLSKSAVNGFVTPPVPGSSLGGTTKDELIIELLASEAVVDSREYEILGAEQVEELKKELKSLATRLNAASKKLKTETKIRDAALALNKVHRRTPSKPANGATPTSLESAELKVQKAQSEYTKISEQYNRVHQRLLEHRSAVLSYSLNRLESLMKPPAAGSDNVSGRTTPANQAGGLNGYGGGDFSPTSAVTSMSLASRSKFEGAHLFAGHTNSKAPSMPKAFPSVAQVSAMEEQLASVEEALKAAKEEEEFLRKEAEDLRIEKSAVEGELGSKIKEANDTIFGLRSELSRMNSTTRKVRELEDEKRQWEDQKAKMEGDLRKHEESAEMLEELDVKDEEIRRLQALLDQERRDREADRIAWEDEKMEDLAKLQQEIDEQRAKDEEAARSADVELDMATERLQALIRTHEITLSPSQRRDMSVLSLANALSGHLDSIKDDAKRRNQEREEWEMTRRKMEADLSASLDKRDKLSSEIEEARQEREAARNQVRTLEERLKETSELLERPTPQKSNSLHSEPGSSNGSRASEDMDRIMSTLRSLWVMLPSREARTTKSNARSTPSPASPLRTNAGREPPSPSLADLDVRALKALYDPRQVNSPLFSNHSSAAEFSIDAFAARVQALVADDRAIIERLLRFAQAHDLLKNNAERAQKLAQESSMGLETYQKQVKALEERNATLVMKQSDLIDEINQLQTAVEKAEKEKRQLDMDLREKEVSLQNLTDANSTLSARALALAEEVATAPESMRIKMEGQLADVRKQLKESMEELEAMRGSEQSQKAALLEELNVVQGEVIKLREDLRTEKRKNGSK